jgi:hypothetical protein
MEDWTTLATREEINFKQLPASQVCLYVCVRVCFHFAVSTRSFCWVQFESWERWSVSMICRVGQNHMQTLYMTYIW